MNRVVRDAQAGCDLSFGLTGEKLLVGLEVREGTA